MEAVLLNISCKFCSRWRQCFSIALVNCAADGGSASQWLLYIVQQMEAVLLNGSCILCSRWRQCFSIFVVYCAADGYSASQYLLITPCILTATKNELWILNNRSCLTVRILIHMFVENKKSISDGFLL